MENAVRKFFDTKTIIVNLLKEDEECYLEISRLQELLDFIYMELRKENKLDDYRILFDVNFNAVERTVLYNEDIFILDLDEKKIYLKSSQKIDDLVERYRVDDTIRGIIRSFAA